MRSGPSPTAGTTGRPWRTWPPPPGSPSQSSTSTSGRSGSCTASCSRDLAGQLQEAIGKATAEAGGPRQQVEAGFSAYFRFVDEQQDAFRILFGGGSKRDEDFAEFVESMEQAFAEMIATLITAGHGEVHRLTLAHGIVGMAEATAHRWIGARADGTDKRDAATVANEVAQLAWAGLRGIRD